MLHSVYKLGYLENNILIRVEVSICIKLIKYISNIIYLQYKSKHSTIYNIKKEK